MVPGLPALLDAVRVQALRDVLRPNEGYLLRKIARWYSKAFCTPLHAVFEIPLEDVLQAYFEERAERMTDEDREEERLLLVETEAQRRARLYAQDAEIAEDEEVLRMIEEEEAEKDRRKAEKKAQEKEEKAETLPRDRLGLGALARESDLPTESMGPIPPDITMTFEDSETFEADLDGFGAMTQPERKQS